MTPEQITYQELRPYYRAAQDQAKRDSEILPIRNIEDAMRFIEEKGYSTPHFVGDIVNSPDVAVVAEHKRKSPSEGDIQPNSDVRYSVEQYRAAGVTALSIVTQNEHFGGDAQDISYASEVALGTPILAKGFINQEYQLYQAKMYGADAALLIVGGLEKGRLEQLQMEANFINLECMLEVHNEAELERALDAEASIIGVNNRSLVTGEVDLGVAESLVPLVPKNIAVVVASGFDVDNPDHIRGLRDMNANAVLIGTTLMRHADPANALKNWLATDQPQSSRS